MARKPKLSMPEQTAVYVSKVVLCSLAFFFTVCLCSADTVRTTALMLVVLTLCAAFLFYSKLRSRLQPPVLAMALFVLMDIVSCFYAASKKFALYEVLKVVAAFCLALLLLAFIGKKEPERRAAVLLECFAAIAGLVSIDLLSTRWISGPALAFLGQFSTDYMDLIVVEEGVRMTSVFIYPNAFADIMGIGVLLALGLTVTSERRVDRAGHLVCLSMSALAFVLTFSMGASLMILPAFLVILLLTGKDRRIELFLLMLETLLVTLLSAFPISATSMTAWNGFRPVPLLCTIGGAAALCALDLLAGQRLAARLAGREKAVFGLIAGLAAMVVAFVIAAYNLTTGITLQPGEALRRSIYPAPGTYVVTAQIDGEPVVTIQSQNREGTMMHTYSTLYQGPLSQASFTVPEDSMVVWLSIDASGETRIDSALYTGENGSGRVPLEYRLLPGFIANRIQGLWANQNAIQRFVFFEDGLKLFRRSPLIGRGLGGYANGLRSVQSFDYVTKYAHNDYIQALAETGLVGFLLFVTMFAVSALSVWRGRKRPMAPALGAALVFVMFHCSVDGIFVQYAALFMAFGLIATIGLYFGDTLPLPAWMKKESTRHGIALGVCAMLVVFGVQLSRNMMAWNLVNDPTDFSQLAQAAALDPFEKADYMLTYVLQASEADVSEEIRQQADVYAARLEKIDSNSIPIYLAEYYFVTGRTEQAFAMAEQYVAYVSADAAVWQKTFDLLEMYEQDTQEYRSAAAHIADLMDEWNARNMGYILLNEETQNFIARIRS